jgi:serine/threonine-protein kinase
VDVILSGEISIHDRELQIRAELIDVASGSQRWGGRFARSLEDGLAAEEELTERIIGALRVRVSGEERSRLARRYNASSEAHDAFLRGRFSGRNYTVQTHRNAIRYFEEAIKSDPQYARAYAGVADAWTGLASWHAMAPGRARPQAVRAAREALRLDPLEPDAHWVMGMINMIFEWDWGAAERDLRKAIELFPNHAQAHHTYGHLLSLLGRDQEAMEHMQLAMRLEPLDAHHAACAGNVFIGAARLDEASDFLATAIDLDPNDSGAHFYQGWLEQLRGNFVESCDEFSNAHNLSGGDPAYLAMFAVAEARCGEVARAQDLLDELLATAKVSFVASADLAKVYAALGDKDEAMRRLKLAYETRDSCWLPFALTGADPGLETLRNESLVTKWLDELGLPAPVLQSEL